MKLAGNKKSAIYPIRANDTQKNLINGWFTGCEPRILTSVLYHRSLCSSIKMKRSISDQPLWLRHPGLFQRDFAVTDVHQLTAQRTDLLTAIFMVIAAPRYTAASTPAGSPVVFFIPKPDPGNTIPHKAYRFTGTAFYARQLLTANRTDSTHNDPPRKMSINMGAKL